MSIPPSFHHTISHHESPTPNTTAKIPPTPSATVNCPSLPKKRVSQDRSPRRRRANWMSFDWMVTRLA